MEEVTNPFGITLRPAAPVLTGLDRAWEHLAVVAECTASQPSGAELAAAINTNSQVAQFTPAIAATLHDAVEFLAAQPDGCESAAAGRLSELIVHLEPRILTGTLRTESDSQRRNTLLHGSVRTLSIRALLQIARAASVAYSQPLPKPMGQLLRRIAREATPQSPNRGEAQRLLRAILTRKFQDVPVRREAGVSQGYRDVFALAPKRRPESRAAPEAERIAQTAIDVDAVGEVVWIAVSEIIESGRQRELLALLEGIPPESAVRGMIIARIAHPELLAKLLQDEPVDFESVDLLLDHLGTAAAKVLLEELAESASRVTRREVYQRVVKLGPEIAPLIEMRLRDRRWFVLRNMISLAREAGCTIGHMIRPFLGHSDARVRREALLLLLRHDATFEEALIKGLADSDRAVLRAALQAARSRLPADAIPVLADRICSSDFPPEFRVMTIHLLGRSNSSQALEALLPFVQAGRTLLGRPRLANKSPEMLAALGNLARTWPGERRVAALLAAARSERDDEVQAATRFTSTV